MSLNCSDLNDSIFEAFNGDASAIKVHFSKILAKKLRIQKRMYQTQLRNMKAIAI